MVGKWIRDTSGVGLGCDPEDGSAWGLCRCGGRGCLKVQGL